MSWPLKLIFNPHATHDLGKLSLAILLILYTALCTAEQRIDIARFSQGDLTGWKTKIFSGRTIYTLQNDNDRIVLFAQSNASASGLYREIAIDLTETPILNWSWKIDNILTGNDEQTRSGDDYPARIYVIFSDGLMFWRTHAINYVWSNNQPVGSSWPNAFTHHAGMIAIASGTDNIKQWVSYSRNVLADYRQFFGDEPGNVKVVAIMTDTDNTGATATAWYGDIWFSAQ